MDPATDVMDALQLSLAIEVMQDAIVVFDDQARIVMANELLLAATGYTREELVGRPVLELLPRALRDELTPRTKAYALAPVPRSLGDGVMSRFERKDGSTFEAQVGNMPILGPAGSLVVCCIRVAEHVSLDEIESRRLLEANPDATFICRPDGSMLLSNAGAGRLFGREQIMLFNQPLTSLFPEAAAPLLEEQLRTCHAAAVADERPSAAHTLDLELVRGDGSAVPVEVTITSLRTAQGLTLRAIVRDISERHRLQRESEAIKDGFLATVSHELRTPLTSVLGYGELLEDLGADDLSAHARSLLDVVLRNARRELRLVDDLLTMVQIGEGTFRIHPSRVSFNDVVLDAVEASAPVAQRAEVSVTVVNLDEVIYVDGDADRLSQAIDNLLTNALKFSPAYGTVTVSLSVDAKTASVSVTNQGDGIGAADVDHVFDRLYRGDNAITAEKQGVGLGLSIVRSIVEAHGGEVDADCTATTTRFEIRLPRAPAT